MSASVITRTAARAQALVPVKDAEAEVAQLKAKLATLLPLEQAAKEQINRRIREIAVLKVFAEAKRLALTPLTWRNAEGMPRLALFQVALGATMSIGANGTTPDLPGGLLNAYRDVQTKAINNRCSYSTKFEGVLPGFVRQIYATAVSSTLFGSGLYVMAEAFKWDAQPVPKRDPLLVAWDGYDLWLLAQFDVTPLERYLVEEFPA